MINIVHINVHCDDERKITALDIKLKSCPEEAVNASNQHLIARVSAAFYSLRLFAECGKNIKMELNPKRQDIVNLHVTFWENKLLFRDVATFIDSFQEALDNAPF